MKSYRWLLIALFFALTTPFASQGGAGKKQPIPDKAAQEKALALVLDIFRDDFTDAKTPEAKAKLASLLLQQGRESRDEPANRFVLYREALTMAALAGDASLSLQIID